MVGVGDVAAREMFVGLIMTCCWIFKRSSPSLGRSPDLLVNASGFPPAFAGLKLILKLNLDRNSDH